MTTFQVAGDLDQRAARKVTRFLDILRHMGHAEALVDISAAPRVRADGWARFVRAIRDSGLSVTVKAPAGLRRLMELTELSRFASVLVEGDLALGGARR